MRSRMPFHLVNLSPGHLVTLSPCHLVTLVGVSLALAASASQKGVSVVPTSGPLAGKQIYANSHALLIGVNEYPKLPKSKWLQYALNDVAALRRVLIESYGFPAENITVLNNRDATRSNIGDALAAFADQRKIKPDDRLLVFFSGHGQTVKLPTGGDMGFLIPYDGEVDLDDLNNAGPYLRTCLPMSRVWEYLGASAARHVLVVADACYSGLLTNARGVSEQYTDEALAQLAALPAKQVITAGAKGQVSLEDSRLGHGAFTFKLVEELRARAANPGTVFTATQLYSRLQVSVSNVTEGKQTPQLGSYKTEGEFLFITTGVSPLSGATETVIALSTGSELVLASNPAGAQVFVDGKAVAGKLTPCTISMDLGVQRTRRIEIGLQLKGHRDFVFEIELQRGKRLSPLPIDLAKVEAAPVAQGGATQVNPKDGAEMVLIPAGEFTMGDDRDAAESPKRKVHLDAYWIYRHEVTVAQYQKYCRATGKRMPNAPPWKWRDTDPIVNVTWDEAMAYCEWAGGRLPTEAEWEKAARGIDGREYPWGSGWDKSRCRGSLKKQGDVGSPVSVGSYDSGASPYGVEDLSGNVFEWCADRYGPYNPTELINPQGPRVGNLRVIRGGSWAGLDPSDFRCTHRAKGEAGGRYRDGGFRCVVSN